MNLALFNMNQNMTHQLEVILKQVKKFNEKRNNSEHFELPKSESSKEKLPEDNKSSKKKQ